MRRSAVVVALLVAGAAACSGSGASDQVVAAPPSSSTTGTAPPVTVPALPPAGMVVQRGAETIVLAAEDGTVLHELPGHYLDSRARPGSIYLWRTGDGVGGRARRLDPVSGVLDPISLRPEDPADWPADPAPVPGAGHWRWLEPSPDGAVVLGQWSAECEVPMAFFVEGGAARPVVAGGEIPFSSHAMGWRSDGRAAVAFPESHCGTAIDRPGIYAVTTGGEATFLMEGERGLTWGS